MQPDLLVPCSSCEKTDDDLGTFNTVIYCPTCDVHLCSWPCFSTHRAPKHRQVEQAPKWWQRLLKAVRRGA